MCVGEANTVSSKQRVKRKIVTCEATLSKARAEGETRKDKFEQNCLFARRIAKGIWVTRIEPLASLGLHCSVTRYRNRSHFSVESRISLC